MILMRSRREFGLLGDLVMGSLVAIVGAALQAPVIMMSQNRQAANDRLDARTDYEVNVRAEMEILPLHTKLDGLRTGEWSRLMALVEAQQASLETISQRLDRIVPTPQDPDRRGAPGLAAAIDTAFPGSSRYSRKDRHRPVAAPWERTSA